MTEPTEPTFAENMAVLRAYNAEQRRFNEEVIKTHRTQREMNAELLDQIRELRAQLLELTKLVGEIPAVLR